MSRKQGPRPRQVILARPAEPSDNEGAGIALPWRWRPHQAQAVMVLSWHNGSCEATAPSAVAASVLRTGLSPLGRDFTLPPHVVRASKNTWPDRLLDNSPRSDPRSSSSSSSSSSIIHAGDRERLIQNERGNQRGRSRRLAPTRRRGVHAGTSSCKATERGWSGSEQ